MRVLIHGGSMAGVPAPAHARRPPPLRSFPGDRAAPPAGEYHDADFEWGEWAVEAGPVLEARLAERWGVVEGVAQAAAPSAPPLTYSAAAPSAPPLTYSAAAWDAFHAKDNASARFYKNRRYLPLAFPDAVAPGVAKLVELGAGAGSSLFPLLRARPTATALATDVSPPALALCAAAAAAAGVEHRLRTAVLDAAAPDAPAALAGEKADIVLLIFTLGALDAARHAAALATAAAALRPGGRLLFRDHGVFDVTHMRAPRLVARVDEQEGARSPALHARSDNTLCFFFTPKYVESLAVAAGLTPIQCRWATVARPNRRTRVVLRRCFVNGVFEKQ